MTCARGCCATYAEHVRSISISSAATPNRRPEAARLTQKDKAWDADHAAYRRLRKQGIQPAGLDNCAQMERGARTRYEIEAGVCMPNTIPTKVLRSKIEQGIDISAANNYAPGVKSED